MRIELDITKREPFTLADVRALLGAASVHDDRIRKSGRFADLRARVAILVLGSLRPTEAAALGWDHVRGLDDLAIPEIDIVATVSGTSWKAREPEWTRPMFRPKRIRTVRVDQVLRGVLREHRAHLIAHALYRPDGPVFPAESMPPIVWRESAVIQHKQLVTLFETAGMGHMTRERASALRRVSVSRVDGRPDQ